MTAVSVRGLTKHFGSIRAVQDLTVDGPSGYGSGFLCP